MDIYLDNKCLFARENSLTLEHKQIENSTIKTTEISPKTSRYLVGRLDEHGFNSQTPPQGHRS